ncbi:hypothetical protein GCM10009682_64200 [Luedemannella flava]|uniref:Thioredoxin family protein n=1 Tax=Luedemannella flava TaxID=349316 RepID=A0ABN2MV85_9ACTN
MTTIELLAWSGCPSHEEARERLLVLLGELGRPDVEVRVRWVETDEEAAEVGFVGSPTFRWQGSDLLPPDAAEHVGLTCRVYRRRDGRFSPLPDPEDLRDAVARAVTDRAGP